MNWFPPESHAQSVALAALHKEGRVIRKRNGSGYLYAYAREFEALAAEVHADLLALKAERRANESGPIVESDLSDDDRWIRDHEARIDRDEDERIAAAESAGEF